MKEYFLTPIEIKEPPRHTQIHPRCYTCKKFPHMIAFFPNDIPCKDGTYYHLATFHIEPHKVPCYHPENGKVAFAPMPYPVFIPPRCKKRFTSPTKKKRRHL